MSDQPVFDFSRWSWGQQKDASRLLMQALHVQALLNKPSILGNREDFDRVMEQLDAITLANERNLCSVLVSVPRGWLVDSAPEEIDWSDPESLNWVVGPRFNDLMAAMRTAQTPEAVSGN